MSGRAINWYLQRITGAALLVLLILHFWVEHFTAEVRTHGLTFEVIQRRFFANHWFVAVDITFLIVATYHGLNGVRNIILDFGRVTRPYRIGVTVVLVALGITLAVWGIGAFRGMVPSPRYSGERAGVRGSCLIESFSARKLPLTLTLSPEHRGEGEVTKGGPVASAAAVAGR